MTPSTDQLPSVTNPDDVGRVLRAARQDAGLSLGAMARRIHYSKPQLSRVESGQRRATPEIVAAYEQALGDDVQRRELLQSLLAGMATPATVSSELVAQAFEAALDAPTLTVDDWLAKVDDYEREYTRAGTAETQARLMADLQLLRPRMDDPRLCAAAARLLTVHGHGAPAALATDAGVKVRWYRLATRTADRSEDLDTQAWTRGRAALALACEGTEVAHARELAADALEMDDRPSLARLSALLGLALTQALDGDRSGAFATYEDACRVFDVVGIDSDDLAESEMQEWRFTMLSSKLLSRLGYERAAVEALEAADRTRPEPMARFETTVELYRGLMLVQTGDPQGLHYAQDVIDKLPPERRIYSLQKVLAEVEQAAGQAA